MTMANHGLNIAYHHGLTMILIVTGVLCRVCASIQSRQILHLWSTLISGVTAYFTLWISEAERIFRKKLF